MSVLFILIGLALLVIGSEFIVRMAVSLSFKLNVSRMIIGLTVVSFATSAPELIICLNAALKGFSDIALGNVIGSNIANIALVLGLSAVIAPLAMDRDFYRFSWPVMMLFSLVLYLFLLIDDSVTRIEGAALLIGMVIYLLILIQQAIKDKAAVKVEEVDEKLASASGVKVFIWLALGSAGLWGGSELLIKGAVDMAAWLGVSERAIAVSVVAIGTSLPELATSVSALLKGEKAITLGNLIGSNIFNIGSVLGITAVLKPIQASSARILNFDIYWMLIFAAVLLPLAFLPKKMTLTRNKGLLLFLAFVVFIFLVFRVE